MIHNEAALRPEYIPRDLYHREGQIEVLKGALTPLTAGHPPDNVTIFGPSGSGKTTIAKYVMERVEEETGGFAWGYVSCLAESSTADVYHRLLEDAGHGVPMQRQGVTIGSYLDGFRSCPEPIVVVIDEADVLPDRGLLAKLYEVSNVSWIAIAADEHGFLADLDSGVESRVRSAETITLDRYSIDELVDILQGRVDAGLASHKVKSGALEEIADRARGNARDAIAILRRAARRVQNDQASRLNRQLVVDVESDAREDVRDQQIGSLGTHMRLVFEIVREAGEISAGDLYDDYESRISDPRTGRTVRRYLEKLEDYYELIHSTGTTSGTRYELQT